MSATLVARSRLARTSFSARVATALSAASLALFAGCFATTPPTGSPTASTASNAQALDLDPVGSVPIVEYQGMPTGDQRLGGVTFRIGESALRVGSPSFPKFPQSVAGVAVDRTFRVAHFLHATNGGAFQQPGHPKHESDGVTIGQYVIRYADGSAETFPLRYGREARDFWNWDRSLPTTDSEVVWNGENPNAAKYGVKVRLYKASWLNPHPEKPVATIDLVSANARAAPVCFAITVDDDPAFAPPVESIPTEPPSATPIAPAPHELAIAPARAIDAQPTTVPPAAPAETISPIASPIPKMAPVEVASAEPMEESPARTIEKPSISDAPPNAIHSADAVGDEDDDRDAESGEEENVGAEKESDEEPEFLGPPPENWTLVVDPAVELPSYTATLPYDRLEGVSPRRLLTPAVPSPFMAVGEGIGETQAFRVFDLRSGKQVAFVDGLRQRDSPSEPTGPALSPDGRLLALHDFGTQSIYVGDVFDKKTLNRFAWSHADPILLFPKPDVLVAVDTGSEPRIDVWQLPQGTPIVSFAIDEAPELVPGLVAVSPGGRYLVLCPASTPTEVATFYDLQKGEKVTSLRLRGRQVDAYFQAFAFSPDGKEFGAYMHGLENETGPTGIHRGIVVWDVKTGRRLYEAPLDSGGALDPALFSSRRPLQWFPDRQAWLLSQVRIFDRQEGRTTRSLSQHMRSGQETTGAQILDDGRLLISDANGGLQILATERPASLLSPDEAPADSAASSRSTANEHAENDSGDSPSVDGRGFLGLLGGPDSSPEDSSEEEELDFLGAAPERWEVFVDPPAALPVYPEELPYERLDGLQPRRLLAPATSSPFIAWETGASDIEGFRVFDLRSGTEVAFIDGLNLLRPVDGTAGPALSPDGKLAAMYDSTSKSIYVGDIGKRKTQNRFSWSESMPILRFAAPDILVAIETQADARVDVWRLPLGAQIASFRLTDEPERRPGLVTLSPGGRFLAICLYAAHRETVTFYDLQLGKEVGSLQKRGAVVHASFNAFAFSPDGKEFAGYVNAVNNETGRENLMGGVVVWDVKTGRPTYRAVFETNNGVFGSELSSSRRPLQWFPDRQGWLLSQLHLFDRREGKIVRSLKEHRHAGVEPTGAQIIDDERLLISDANGGMKIVEVEREPLAKPNE